MALWCGAIPTWWVASATESTTQKAAFDKALSGGRVNVVWVFSRGACSRESVVLPNRSAGPTYPLSLDLPTGVTVRQAGGNVESVSTKGGVFGTVVGDRVRLCVSTGGGASDGGARGQAGVGDGVAVGLSGREWLSDPARVFPVTVDPGCCSPIPSATVGEPGLGAQVVPPSLFTPTLKVRGGSSPQRGLIVSMWRFTMRSGKSRFRTRWCRCGRRR